MPGLNDLIVPKKDNNIQSLIIPKNKQSEPVITPTGNTVNGVPTFTLENPEDNTVLKSEVKPVEQSPYTPLFNQYFKEFGGTDINDDVNYNNIYAAQKAGEATASYISNYSSMSADDVQQEAVKTIKNKESEIKNLQNILKEQKAPKPIHTNIPEDSFSQDPYNLESTITKESKDLEDLKAFYQGELSKKTLYGFQDNINEFLPEISATLQPQDLLNTGITLQNVGDLKRQRNLKTIASTERAYSAYDILSGYTKDGELTQNKYQMSDIDRAYYTYAGGTAQIESLKWSMQNDQLAQKQIQDAILKYNEQLGDDIETPQDREYINQLETQKKAYLKAELEKTQLIDKINGILEVDSKPYISYQEAKKLQDNKYTRGFLAPDVLRTVNDLFTTTQVGAANVIEKLTFAGSEEDYQLLSEELESRKNRIAASFSGILKGTISTDVESQLKETPFYFDEKGNFQYDLRLLPALAARITLESAPIGQYGAVASGIRNATLQKVAQAGLMYIPSASLFGDRILRGEELKGLPKDQAFKVAASLIAVETISELVNPLEIELFTGKPSSLVNLSINDAQRLAYKTALKKAFGSNKYDKLVDLITDSKIFAKEAFRQGNMEYLEEAVGSLMTEGVNFVTSNANPDYQTDSELNAQDQFVSYLSTMVGMFPMASVSGYRQIQEANKTSLYLAAENPEVFLQGIKADLSKGRITLQEAQRRIKVVEQASLVKTQLIDSYNKIDELTTKSGKPVEQGVKEDLKYQLFSQNFNINNLKEQIVSEKSEKEQEALLEELNSNLELFSETIQSVEQPIPDISIETKQRNLLNDSYSDKYINSLVNPNNISQEISTLQQEKVKFTQPEVQFIYDEKIEKLKNRLSETQEEQKSIFTQESNKLKNLTKEELESYKIPKEIKGEERKQLVQAKIERERQLEDEENTLTFQGKDKEQSIPKGQWVKIEGQPAIYKAKDFQNNRFIATFSDGSQDISINPKENLITPLSEEEAQKLLSPQEAQEEQIESKEQLESIFGKQEDTPTDNIEAKKADIERRREEELEQEAYRTTTSSELYQDENGDYYKVEKLKDGRNKVSVTDENGRTLTVLDTYDSKVPFDKIIAGGLTKIKDLPFTTKMVDRINAKYDAELAALEENIEIIPTQEEVLAQQELERLQEEEAKEKQEKEQLSTEKKEIEDKIKYSTYNPLGTISPFEQDVNLGIVEKTSINSLKWLQTQLNTTGKSLSDLGYYITVHSVVDFPKEKYFKQWQDYWDKTNTPDDKRSGLIAVVTDREGNIKLFNEAGEPSTEGNWSIHQVRKSFKQPEDLSPQRLAEWKLDVEKAEKLQKAVKPSKPIVIQSTIKAASPKLSKGTIANNYQKGDYTFSIGAQSEIKTKDGAFKIFTGKKIGDVPNIAEAIYDYLNINNSEGLPEPFISTSKDDIKTAFWNRLSFREFNAELKTFPEIFAYTRQSLVFQVNEDGTPYITDKNKPGSYKIEGRQNFIDFLKKEQLNLHKRAEYNTPLDVYYFKDGQFELQTIDYKDFVANNFETQVSSPVGNPHFVFETAVKKINPVKDTPVEEKPVLDQPQTPAKKKFDFGDIKKEEDTIDDITDSTGLDRIISLSQKVTKEQEIQAKTWFDEYLSRSGATFEDSRNIANSTAFATWKQGAITLWKSGKYTDLYHEAWHDFTQMFLTKEQKKALYEEAEKSEAGQKAIKVLANKLGKNPYDLSEIQKFFALEELLAEDFYNYKLSGQKLILNQRPKRNTIFRKIYNFLKYILTGKPDLERLYKQLANNQINKALRDPSNALFGKLNKSIEGLSIQDSINLYKAIDAVIAEQLNKRGISISRVFLEANYLNKVYGTVKNSLLESAQKLSEEYDDKPNSNLEYTLNNLQYTLQNWKKVKEAHKNNSTYLKVSKELVPYEEYSEEGDELETNQEKYGEQRENQNPIDNVSQYILYMIASLPKYEYKAGKPVKVFNEFLPNVQDTVDFGIAWGQLSKKLEGDKDYTSMYNKVKKLSEEQPSFVPLLLALPSPSKDLNRYELQLVASFINALSKPIVNLKTTSIEYQKDGRVNIQSRNAEPITIQQLKNDWNLALQELPNEYTEETETSQKALNLSKIIDDFKYLSSKNSQEFLNALGFTFSEGTKNSPEMQDILNLKNNVLKTIYNKLKAYNDLRNKKYPNNLIPSQAQLIQIERPMSSPVDVLSKSIWVDGKNLYDSPKDIIDNLISLELRYSEQYHADSVSNSEGNNQWLHKDWSLQSQDYSLLNDTVKFPTYQDLIQDPIGGYFNIDINPDADNIFLHSLFVLDVPKTNENYGKRRTIQGGKTATLELFDQNGIRIAIDNEREGIKASRLPRFLALIQDIPTLLTTGEKQHPRYGDKSTSRGTMAKYPSFVKNVFKANSNLPVDLRDSKFPNQVSDQAWFILRNSLISTLQITNNQTSRKLYENTANLPKNIQYIPFGKFDKILSKETKELLKSATSEETINISSLIETHKDIIKKDIANYFISQTQLVLDELKENSTITQKDYIPDYLLKNNSLEELIHSFVLNTWIINSEHERLIFQDSRYYDMKVDREAKRNLREPFKRYSKASSTGTIATNNQQINSFFNNPESNSFAEKVYYDSINKDNPSLPYTEQGIVNSVIVNDIDYTATDVITNLLKYLKNAPEIEQEAIKKQYTDLTVSDAMAVCTLDFYRNIKLRIGEEGWSDESEKLYQKIARGEKLTKEDEANSFLFFSPIKFRVAGRTFDNTTFTPVDYKFAITPLLPTTVRGKAFETIKNNMIRQNAHLLLFKSASKHSAITNKGKYNNLYSEDGTPFTGDYVFNQVPIEYFYEVVNAPESYKEEARYSTQLRTLLFVNLFDNGKPQDYSKSKDSWDKLSEAEKKKASPSYRRATEFRDNIDSIVQIRKEKLLKEIGAVQKPDGTYSIDDAKLSNVLEREFERKNLPLNVLKSIQITENGTFKFPFDATIARDEIENTILSIIDNQLRKQDVYGESLIQVSSAGFEVKQDDTLPFYKDLGRTLPDGTKVTSAHKVKIAIQGDFKKLLQHPDVLSLSAKDKITPLEALNQLIKDESWLNKGDNRQLITITGVRIPVQGLNSQEFMEVHEFLPTESGNIIVVSPALVAKSGGDFDWDKITSYFPHIYIDNNGDVLPVKKLSDSEIKELYNSLSKELKAYLKEFQKEKDKELSPKELQTFLSANKLISNIFGEDLTNLVFDSFSQNTIPSKNQFVNLYKERVAHNNNITIMREVLENPNNYVNLLLPNATYMFEDIADERRNAEQKEKPSLSDNYTITESLNQHESNFVGKDALGIGAIYNKFLPILQQAGAYLNDTYTSNIEFGTTRNTRNRFPHNTTKDGNISVSGVWSVDKPNRGKYKISEAISQLMNGWVDVAKKDWIFYINGRKEFAPTILFHLMQGTHKDDVIAFFNQPVLYDYMNILSNYRNPLIRATNRAKYNNAKKEAIYQSLMKYLPNDLTITTYKFKKPVTVNVKEELTEKYNGENPAFFYGFVSNELRQLADDNQQFFNSDKFDYYKFAIPEGNKLAKPETNEEKLSQALYLIQFLELEEQTKLFNQMRRTMNNDTSKASSFQYSATRAFEQEITKLHNLVPDNVVDKMINESSIAAFTNQTTGIDKFISQITPELFEITNNPEFNKFLNAEWNKPEKENFIAFSDKDQDTKEAWIKTFKNDFILYLYDNNVFDENDNLVASKIYQQMQYNTALGNEIEAIKREFPTLAKNNLFLNYLIKDNSLKLNSQGKPEKVNIKLKHDKLDKDNSDIMTQDFQKLINFDDPNYTIEQQNRIKTFASNLQDFAYVQSGLNKTPYYISKYIPQDAFAGKIQSVVEKIADIFNNSPEKAQEILKRFNAKFRFNNPKFYTQQYDENGEPSITFNIHEPSRYKPYIDEKLDLFGKKALENAEKLKKKTTIQPSFEANEAKENPTSLFIFGDSKDQKATQNSAKITLSKEGNSFKRTAQENIIGIPVFNTRDSYFNDDQFSENQALIDNAIKQILDKESSYSNIVFSENLFETSKLSEKSPNTYNYAVSKLNTIFGTNYQPVEEVMFETEQTIEEPIKIEENIKEGVDFVFEQSPELANIGTKEQYSQYLDTIFPESKVKDIVYHGTDFKFDSFEKKKLGINTGALSAYKGFFFTNNVEVAKSYVEGDVLKGEPEYFAESMTKEDWEDYDNELLKKEKQIKEDPLYGIKFVKLNLKNPEVIDYEGNEDRKIKYSVVLEKALENRKDSVFLLNTYDTFLFGNTNEESNVYVTFEPEQIHILGNKQDIEGFKQFVGKEESIQEVIDKSRRAGKQIGDKFNEYILYAGNSKTNADYIREGSSKRNSSSKFIDDFGNEITQEYIDKKYETTNIKYEQDIDFENQIQNQKAFIIIENANGEFYKEPISIQSIEKNKTVYSANKSRAFTGDIISFYQKTPHLFQVIGSIINEEFKVLAENGVGGWRISSKKIEIEDNNLNSFVKKSNKLPPLNPCK